MTFQRFLLVGRRLAMVGALGIALGACSALPRSTTPPTADRSSTSIPPSPTPSAATEPTAEAARESPVPSPTPVTPVQGSALELIRAFIEAPYRVVAVAKNPFAPYSLIVAAERSEAACGSPDEPQRCTADETCGSLYTSSTCFFFVEPAFDAEADPVTRYVTRWPDEPTIAALATDSFRFVDARTVEFRAAGADGAFSVQEVWWLDLVTGALAMQSRVEGGGGAP
jgi:hypothetical protein